MVDEIASLQVTKEEYVQHGSIPLGQRIVEDLQSAGKKPYFIPVGGSNALGTWGYLNFFQELIDQSSEAPFTDIVMVRGLQHMNLACLPNPAYSAILLLLQLKRNMFMHSKPAG